jgi:hypothetical protein
MRGSLLAGKPYPTAASATATAEEPARDGRLDEVLHALHRIEGQLQDLFMTLEEVQGRRSSPEKVPAAAAPTNGTRRARAVKAQPRRPAPAAKRARQPRKGRG